MKGAVRMARTCSKASASTLTKYRQPKVVLMQLLRGSTRDGEPLANGAAKVNLSRWYSDSPALTRWLEASLSR